MTLKGLTFKRLTLKALNAHTATPEQQLSTEQVTSLRLTILFLTLSFVLIGIAIANLSTSLYQSQTIARPSRTTAASTLKLPTLPAWEVEITSLPAVRTLPNEAAQRHPLAPSTYKQSMAVGYAAYQQQDYHTALINFKRALAERAGDRYAAEAVANTTAIIQHQSITTTRPPTDAQSPTSAQLSTESVIPTE